LDPAEVKDHPDLMDDDQSTMGLELSIYKEKIWYLPKDVPPYGFSIEKVSNVNWLGDVVVNLLKSFHPRLLEDCPWLPSEMERWEWLRSLERMFLCDELLFAIWVLSYRAVRR